MSGRVDFIENRIDVIKNIFTLYSYILSEQQEVRMFAGERLKRGSWYIVEKIGNQLFFAPSRFVGYKDNSIEKYNDDRGDGRYTNEKFKQLSLYKEFTNEYIEESFNKLLNSLDLSKIGRSPQFLIPQDCEVEDLIKERSCFFICPTHCKGQKENAWKSFLEHNLMAIGWADEDYSNYSISDIEKKYSGDNSAIAAFSTMKQIKSGDIICCTHNSYGLWGIGVAVSSYKFQKGIHYAGIDKEGNDSYYSHFVDVVWLKYHSDTYISVQELNIPTLETMWQPYGTLSQRKIPQYILNYLFNSKVNMESLNKLESNIINLLKANKNLILTGAPGTGKTYLAKEIVKAMNAKYEMVQFHPSYDYTDFVEGLRPIKQENSINIDFKRKDGAFKAFCKLAVNDQFEVSFSKAYNQLVEEINKGEIETIKLRSRRNSNQLSITVNNNIQFRGGNGIQDANCVSEDKLYTLYQEYDTREKFDKMDNVRDCIINTIGGCNTTFYWAVLNNLIDRIRTKKLYIFIIDEINRGEVSKIFGELFYSIDPGYRGENGRVKTQYSNLIEKGNVFEEGFYVPENVYIIGTMNDIDRSVECMDFAFRRRFAWQEIKFEDTLDEIASSIEKEEWRDEAKERLLNLNKVIENDENLGSAYCIGGSYLLKLDNFKDENNMENAFQMLWDYHIKNVLFEYLRGLPDNEIKEKMVAFAESFDTSEE
jgi:GTPase subunit of restriction endonuclease